MLVGDHQIIVHWIKGASAIEFFFLNKFCGFVDKVIQICFYYCRIFHVLMKSEYDFSTISKTIETGVYVHLYLRKSLGYLFSFVVFYRLTLFYQIRFDYVHLLKRLLHFSIPNKLTWRKNPQTKAVSWKRHKIEITIIFIVQDFFLLKQN